MPSSPLRVVVAGGGIAGLEALLALRGLAGERVAATLVAREPDFSYRPLAVAEHGVVPASDAPAPAGEAVIVRRPLSELDGPEAGRLLALGRQYRSDAPELATLRRIREARTR